jgi:hypothetical protein
MMPSFFLKLRTVYLLWLKQWAVERLPKKPDLKSFLVRIGTVLLLYVILDRFLTKTTNLPFINYQEPFIYFAFLKHVFTTWYLLVVITSAFGLFMFRKSAFCSWTDFPQGNLIRFLVIIASGTLTWVFATYNYNLYYDQGHYCDRFLLIICLLLVYWRPVFVLPFLTILLPIIWQFTVLPGFSFAIPFLPIRLLTLFSTFFLIYLFVRKLPIADFVFLTGCLIATHYWAPGFAKLRQDWILYDRLYFLMPATYANGWLGFLDAQTISLITQKLSYFNIPLKILTAIFEFGSMFFFLNRHSVRFFLCGWVFFHLGIFFVTGIFFWVWILLDGAFLYLFLKKDGISTLPIFNLKYLIVSVILIISGSLWSKPVALAWFDVPITYTYRFEAETEGGKTYKLPPKFFAPFDYQFTLGSFAYLDNKPLISIVWGTSSHSDIGKQIMKLDSDKLLFAFEEKNGKVYFDEKSKAAFNLFIKQYIRNWNKRFSNQTYLSYIEAPRFLWTFPTSASFEQSKQPIKRIKVIQVMSFYNHGNYREIRESMVNDISID